jgi:hypothetical protein
VLHILNAREVFGLHFFLYLLENICRLFSKYLTSWAKLLLRNLSRIPGLVSLALSILSLFGGRGLRSVTLFLHLI